MAKKVIRATDVKFGTVGGALTDHSGEIKAANLSVSVADEDSDDFEAGKWTEKIGTKLSGTFAITTSDNDDGALETFLWDNLGELVEFSFQEDGDKPKDAGNAIYSGQLLVNSFAAGGQRISLSSQSYTFPLSGTLARDVGP